METQQERGKSCDTRDRNESPPVLTANQGSAATHQKIRSKEGTSPRACRGAQPC